MTSRVVGPLGRRLAADWLIFHKMFYDKKYNDAKSDIHRGRMDATNFKL